MEKSDLESERLRLVEDVLENKATMKELEDNLLEKLTSVEGVFLFINHKICYIIFF